MAGSEIRGMGENRVKKGNLKCCDLLYHVLILRPIGVLGTRIVACLLLEFLPCKDYTLYQGSFTECATTLVPCGSVVTKLLLSYLLLIC